MKDTPNFFRPEDDAGLSPSTAFFSADRIEVLLELCAVPWLPRRPVDGESKAGEEKADTVSDRKEMLLVLLMPLMLLIGLSTVVSGDLLKEEYAALLRGEPELLLLETISATGRCNDGGGVDGTFLNVVGSVHWPSSSLPFPVSSIIGDRGGWDIPPEQWWFVSMLSPPLLHSEAADCAAPV